jgi:hypothetical protein
VVGQIQVYKDGVIYDTVNLVSAENVERADFGDYFGEVARNWAI